MFRFSDLVSFALTPPPVEAWDLWREAISAPEHPAYDADIRETGFENVVLLSGGQDSTVAYRLSVTADPKTVAIYIDFGEPYQRAEIDVLRHLGVLYLYYKVDVNYDQRDKRWRHIMPARNLVALEIAARAGGAGATLWLGSVAGEVPEAGGDKSVKFHELATSVFAQMYGTKAIRTLADKTKAEWAYWWRTTQPDPDTLLQTVTCYHADGRHCGTCQACVRRYCALVLAGYAPDDVLRSYAAHPLYNATEALNKYILAYQQEMLSPGVTKYGQRRAWQDLSVLDPKFLADHGFGGWTWQ